MYFYLASVEDPVFETWSWELGISAELGKTGQVTMYINSLYVCFLMLIGENTLPVSDTEKVFAMLVMLVGACIYATIMGAVALLVSSFNQTSARYNERISEVDEHMRNLQPAVRPCNVALRQPIGSLYFRTCCNPAIWPRLVALRQKCSFNKVSP